MGIPRHPAFGVPQLLPVAAIHPIPDNQPRKGLDKSRVKSIREEYKRHRTGAAAGALASKAVLVCPMADSTEYALHDGFHRHEAALQEGATEMWAYVATFDDQARHWAMLMNQGGCQWTRTEAMTDAARGIRAGRFRNAGGIPMPMSAVAAVYEHFDVKEKSLWRYCDKLAKTDDALADELAATRARWRRPDQAPAPEKTPSELFELGRASRRRAAEAIIDGLVAKLAGDPDYHTAACLSLYNKLRAARTPAPLDFREFP